VGATTPLWVPLVVAVLGLLGTAGGAIAGVLITQRRSDRRDEKTWERERERERERWAREDVARTFELRRESYVEYYEAVGAVIEDYDDILVRRFMASTDDVSEAGGREYSEERQRAHYSAFDRVQLYGTPGVLEKADQTADYIMRTRSKVSLEATAELRSQRFRLRQAIRADLGVPLEAFEPSPAEE
jgi:hypothetical protein